MAADAAPAPLNTALDQFRALTAEVEPDDLEREVRCAGWTVADVIDHVVHGIGNFATMVSGAEVDWSAEPAHVAADPLPAFDEAVARLRAAWPDGGPDAPLGMALAELATHAWDLADGLGRRTDDLDQDVAEQALAFMQANLSDDARGTAFGPAQSAPDGADAYTRLAAFAGRQV